jgi:Asp-tRNA(Asn)/Glu-tRNA(Gln) amidotransferase A subunit family amidase
MTAIHHVGGGARRRLRKGALSPVEAVRAALARITAWDGKSLRYTRLIIDWPQTLDADFKGKRIGLVHDIGAGLEQQPQVREAIGAAARAFAGAGVEVTPEMIEGESAAERVHELVMFSLEAAAPSAPARRCDGQAGTLACSAHDPEKL